MAIEWRLSDEDWAIFGGPEWLLLDWEAFAEWPWGRLDELESEMGMSIRRARLLLADGTARGIKAALWLARKTTGDPVLDIAWDVFDIQRPLKAKTREPKAAGDAGDPPDQSSPANSAGEQTSPPDSSNSSAAAEPSEISTIA